VIALGGDGLTRAVVLGTMSARLLTTLTVATAFAAAAAVTACSGADELPSEGEIKKSTQASSVVIKLFDASGNELGSCSGTLVSPEHVLTAGHCAVGASQWKIDARAAGKQSTASRAVTPWKNFKSSLSHPDHADIALLVLDTAIELPRYPEFASSQLADGAGALRFLRASATANVTTASVSVNDGATKGFRLAYTASVEAGDFLDTGGALIDPKTGKIHGVVSSLGLKSKLLYIARTDNYATWLRSAQACGGVETGGGLAPRTYGTSSSSSSGGWGGGGGDWGGYGGSNKGGIDAGTTVPGAGDAGAGGGTGSDSGAGASSSSSSGSSGNGSGPGTGGGTGGGGGCPGTPSCSGSDCPGGSNSSGSDGANGGSSSGGSSSGGGGTSSGGGSSSGGSSSGGGGTTGSSSGGTTTETCQGSGDNPDVCPPDSQACNGPNCGGCGGVNGCVDGTMDYGDCGSCGAGTTGSPVIR
jgi:Trypsin